ncbi:MAG: hypothetical protein WBA77_19140 [Microcoleaceae cyanobacterium]
MKSSPKTVYLHIGLHKTGSTTIQHFLKDNKNILLKLGYLYPESGSVYSGQHNLSWQLSQDPRYSRQYGGWEELYTEIASTSVNNVILSSEDFEILKPKQINLLRLKLQPYHTKIIVYIRRQDSLIQSVYTQQVKGGLKKTFEEFLREAINLKCKTSKRFQFHLHLRPWKKQFGLENIIVRPLETHQLYQEDLCLDFLNCIGFPVSNLSRDTQNSNKLFFQADNAESYELILPQNKNESPSYQTLEIMRFISNVISQKVEKDDLDLKQYLKPILRYYQNSQSDSDKFNQLTQQLSLDILKTFEKSNRIIAEEYLLREDGKLFSDEIKERDITHFNISEISSEQQLEVMLILIHDIWKKLDTIQQDIKTLKSSSLNLNEIESDLEEI